jgi:ABC-2 type transport system permease protein
MTTTLLRIAWLGLVRDRAALALTFVLPIVFFSIFAVVFGGMAGGSGAVPAVEVVLVDEDGTPASQRMLDALVAEEGLEGPGKDAPRPPVLASRVEARARVEAGKCDAAIILPEGFGAAFGGTFAELPRVVILADAVANPIAPQVLQGLLQKIAMTATPDLMVEKGVGMLDQFGGGLTPEQRQLVDSYLATVGTGGETGEGATDGGAAGLGAGLVETEVVDVRKRDDQRENRQRMVAFQAAGVGVMFLLFSMSGAASSLLQEEQTGTLERLLNADVGMGRMLLGYWAFAALIGCVQLVVMFVWGWAIFGLDLFTPTHLVGFAVMTLITAAAASAFGLVLGTACRSLGQLNGISTLVILVMSAFGGSMFPRFLMKNNPVFDKLGLLTFNAWAIDGYQKVFWYETGLLSLWPQVLVLLLVTVVCLAIARRLARRWEAS